MYRVFIDGRAGTTGLRIFDRLEGREDIELITLSEEDRKKSECRKEAINSADIAFLCLPDVASIEAVEMANDNVKIIDTSTAHRTLPNWAYGFPELSENHLNKIVNSNRVAVPGCHASGLISLIYPLIDKGIISPDCNISCSSLTGYSGAGKKTIAEYESNERPTLWDAPREYGITQMHKHLKEMKLISGLSKEPIFTPIIGDFYSGMLVTIGLFKEQLKDGKTVEHIKEAYASLYNSNIVSYCENVDEEGFVSANALSGKDSMQIFVEGNEDRILLMARYDNLGKGASGAALQCMNILLGQSPDLGLNL